MNTIMEFIGKDLDEVYEDAFEFLEKNEITNKEIREIKVVLIYDGDKLLQKKAKKSKLMEVVKIIKKHIPFELIEKPKAYANGIIISIDDENYYIDADLNVLLEDNGSHIKCLTSKLIEKTIKQNMPKYKEK
jgi:hypothetical protein